MKMWFDRQSISTWRGSFTIWMQREKYETEEEFRFIWMIGTFLLNFAFVFFCFRSLLLLRFGNNFFPLLLCFPLWYLFNFWYLFFADTFLNKSWGFVMSDPTQKCWDCVCFGVFTTVSRRGKKPEEESERERRERERERMGKKWRKKTDSQFYIQSYRI